MSQLYILPLITGSIFILAGIIMQKFPPKKINSIYGYRTPSSMKSQERWDFAQRFSAKEMIKTGVFLSLSSTIGLYYQPSEYLETIIGLGLMFLFLAIMFFRVEMEIKRRHP